MLDTAFVFGDIRSLATTEERHRLAREIHDGVAQELAGLAYVVDDASARADDPELRADLHRIRDELSRVVSELRLSIFELRSGVDPGTGLGASISTYVRQIGGRAGMTVHLVLEEDATRLPTDVEVEIMRIVQEAVTNARRHSRAKNLWVTLRTTPRTRWSESPTTASGSPIGARTATVWTSCGSAPSASAAGWTCGSAWAAELWWTSMWATRRYRPAPTVVTRHLSKASEGEP